MSYADGPLPQWTLVGDYGSGTYEAEDPHGVSWRLWLVEQPASDDPLPPGYRLAPRDAPGVSPAFITRKHGLYFAMDKAGMQIAGDAVRADWEGARRQLGLDD
ncbi:MULTISPECIES: hypothetical protein [unclassified Streptomyces]|uniref:hypothetical protein n=1 Tax=unclassified Streptomyces TaxID=2593676 RepID=UPI0033D0DE6A